MHNPVGIWGESKQSTFEVSYTVVKVSTPKLNLLG